MITVEEWEQGRIDLGDELFVPVFEEWFDNLFGPFQKCVAYRGTKSGKDLHPDFVNILELI